jgi:peptidoglycan hydrolase CwlO-like protein
MRTRHIWLMLVIAVTFILGGILEARSIATKEERESYKKQIEEKLKTIEKQIGELKEKGAEVEAEYKEEMKDLRNKEKTAKVKLKELKRGRTKVWDKSV